MYPLQFRPNVTAKVYGNNGTLLNAAADMQIFKPMLALEQNNLPSDWNLLGVPGGIILRFACQDNSFAHQNVGPSNWPQSDFPFFRLNDDILQETWYVWDALSWSASPEDILAGFASKSRSIPNAATPEALAAGGANAAYANPFIRFGRLYHRAWAPGADEWYNLQLAPGTGLKLWYASEANLALVMRCTGYEGSVETPTNRWDTVSLGGILVPAAPQGAYNGAAPITFIRFRNNGIAASDTTFGFFELLTTTRRT